MSIDWQPAWSSKVIIESGGRFPLGLNRFHDALEDMLIKSITVMASRLRYITYCCWAVGDIKKNENCKEYSEFTEAFTRRENSLAVGLYLIKPEHAIYGNTALSKWVKKDEHVQNCSFKLMQSVNIGAFELYYAGTIYNFGLTVIKNSVTELTKSGQALYAIAERYYSKKKPRYHMQYKGKRIVPTDVLKEWGEVNVFNIIKDPECREERDFFKFLVFHLKSKGQVFRRDTFALFLESIEACQRHDTVFDEDRLRNIHYYSCFKDSNGNVVKFIVPEYLIDAHFYWRIYEGHVYFRWWLDSYFQVFINHLKSCEDRGSTIDEFFSLINKQEFNKTITFFTGILNNFYDGSMTDILSIFQTPCRLEDDCSEETLSTDSDTEKISARLARFVLMMAALHVKFKGLRNDTRYQYVVNKQQGNLWFNVLYHIQIEQMTVREFLTKILKTYVISQHDQVMMEKRDLRKSWFTKVNKRYFFNADVFLLWRPAKFNTIIDFLNDMNLIDIKEGCCRLTSEGRDFYNKLKVDYYEGD